MFGAVWGYEDDARLWQRACSLLPMSILFADIGCGVAVLCVVDWGCRHGQDMAWIVVPGSCSLAGVLSLYYVLLSLVFGVRCCW